LTFEFFAIKKLEFRGHSTILASKSNNNLFVLVKNYLEIIGSNIHLDKLR
jgi:hypothetical protein